MAATDNMLNYLTTKVISNSTSPKDEKEIDNDESFKIENNEKCNDVKSEIESEEEREKGWSDMTETEASESDEDEAKLVIDVSNRVNNKLTSNDLDSTRVRSLEETMKFLEGNHNLTQEMSVDGDSQDEDSDEEIVISSSGAPDKYGFLTEIYIPKMRGFEELSDRCILDSVSVSLTLDQVVRSSMDQFNNYMRNTELTDTQREVTKYVRRRARNRVSARKSRMKKLSDIVRLGSEIKIIRHKKDSLRQERSIMEKLRISWRNRVAVLHDYIVQYLKEHKEKDDISLDFKDGNIIIISKDNKDDHKAEISEKV